VKLLPVALNVEGKRCLIVGGGPVAQRKTKALQECGARLHVVAPDLCDCFAALRPHIEYSQRVFNAGDCAGHDLVFACTNRREVNALVAAQARAAGLWCNVADDPAASDLHTVATLRRDAISIGVSTGVTSPLLARHIREQVARCIGEEYAQLLQIVSEVAESREAPDAAASRADVWRGVLASEALQLLRDGQRAEAEKLVRDLLK
jgi:siroheme synthase-like protein